MKKVLGFLSNKFIYTGLAFAIWMIFFDQNNYTSQTQRKNELKAAEKNIAWLNTEIARMENDYVQLVSNPTRLEEYAREEYKMKKDNEDVYLIEKK